jgi:predicted esterase
MRIGRKFLPGQRGLLALLLILSACLAAMAESHPAKKPSSEAGYAKLMAGQDVAADRPIFDADAFPKIKFANADLITAALGPFTMKIRYFDAAYNEVEKPTAPGRYGARVEIRFPNGYSDIQEVTLFKTPKPYRTYRDIYTVTARFPDSFGLSNDIQTSEAWNMQHFFFDLIRGGARRSDDSAALVASLYDIQADPARWHGFDTWRVNDAWWNGLEKKLGMSQDYKRIVTLPDGYAKKKDQHWPLILFLHGSGECGHDLDMLKDKGPLGYINKGHSLPFIVVTPQCPKDDLWDPEKLALLLDKIEAQFRVDPKRIYVTGLSLGGYGSFDLAATYPQRITAIAPLSGGENPEIAERIKTVPTWIFHGSDDAVVRTQYSIDIADRMKAVGATEVKLTIYPGVGHEKWEVTYADPALYAWFLQHSLP